MKHTKKKTIQSNKHNNARAPTTSRLAMTQTLMKWKMAAVCVLPSSVAMSNVRATVLPHHFSSAGVKVTCDANMQGGVGSVAGKKLKYPFVPPLPIKYWKKIIRNKKSNTSGKRENIYIQN